MLATNSTSMVAERGIIRSVYGCHLVVGLISTEYQGIETITPTRFSRFGDASSTNLTVLTWIDVTRHYDHLIVPMMSVVGAIIEADDQLVSVALFLGLVDTAEPTIKKTVYSVRPSVPTRYAVARVLVATHPHVVNDANHDEDPYPRLCPAGQVEIEPRSPGVRGGSLGRRHALVVPLPAPWVIGGEH